MKVNFSNYFEVLATSFRDVEALVNVERNRRYTFGELHLLTNRIVNMMQDVLLLGEGDCYLCVLQNDNLSLLHFPTIFKGPATCVFSNYRDSLDEQEWQVRKFQPKVVFIETDLLATHNAMLRNSGATIVAMDRPDDSWDGVLCFWDLVASASDANPDVVLDDRDHIALIRMTGGTTGRGKAVPYTIDNWLAQRDSCYALPEVDWSGNTRALHMAPMSHGSATSVLPTFCSGGCTVTMNDPDLTRFCQVVEQERVSHTMAVPTMLYRLLEVPGAEKYDMSSLSAVYYGGAPMSATKLAALQARFGNVFLQCYAASESIAISISLSKADHRVSTLEGAARLASAGRITGFSEVLIVDEAGSPVPAGEVGELWMRSRTTVTGYFDNPEQSAEEFSDGYWKSGDMARVDSDGYVTIVDRKKDMIISGGFNVYAIEVEEAICTHDAVLMAAVIGIPHEEWGEAVHAEVVLREGAALSATDLIQHTKEKIGSFKAPKGVEFVAELPVTPVGKVLRRLVRQKYWSGSDRSIS